MFDARGLMEEFEDVVFAEEVAVERVHLLRMREVEGRYLVVGEKGWGEGGRVGAGEEVVVGGGGARLEAIM